MYRDWLPYHSGIGRRHYQYSPARTIKVKFKAIVLGLVILVALLLSSCSGEVNGVPEPRSASSTSITSGRRLLADYGCGSCHLIPGVPGANSMAGPPLQCFYQRTYIAGRLPNSKENLMKWIRTPQQVEPGNAMPDLGVSEAEASDMADYLYDPPAYFGWTATTVVQKKCSL